MVLRQNLFRGQCRSKTEQTSGTEKLNRRQVGETTSGRDDKLNRRQVGETTSGRDDKWERQQVGETTSGRDDKWERRQVGETTSGRDDKWGRRQVGETTSGTDNKWERRQVGQTTSGRDDKWERRQGDVGTPAPVRTSATTSTMGPTNATVEKAFSLMPTDTLVFVSTALSDYNDKYRPQRLQ
ncbi:unnamed protein product [Cyprideis torosa]|uniref:Uncharacterized protein n=1 Tax=Cyprideis torosa TaxID=163714 RepID=A0A7R8ZLM4_9CRUS|nr:unnamed protein product [Cyprideis torosa]CAG0893578.1 unnamed protein product [Cyprideis torosa]